MDEISSADVSLRNASPRRRRRGRAAPGCVEARPEEPAARGAKRESVPGLCRCGDDMTLMATLFDGRRAARRHGHGPDPRRELRRDQRGRGRRASFRAIDRRSAPPPTTKLHGTPPRARTSSARRSGSCEAGARWTRPPCARYWPSLHDKEADRAAHVALCGPAPSSARTREHDRSRQSAPSSRRINGFCAAGAGGRYAPARARPGQRFAVESTRPASDRGARSREGTSRRTPARRTFLHGETGTRAAGLAASYGRRPLSCASASATRGAAADRGEP